MFIFRATEAVTAVAAIALCGAVAALCWPMVGGVPELLAAAVFPAAAWAAGCQGAAVWRGPALAAGAGLAVLVQLHSAALGQPPLAGALVAGASLLALRRSSRRSAGLAAAALAALTVLAWPMARTAMGAPPAEAWAGLAAAGLLLTGAALAGLALAGAAESSRQTKELPKASAPQPDPDPLLSAGLVHDLKTPVSAIIGFSEIMDRESLGPMPDAYREYAAIIQQSGQQLLLMVDSLLDYSKAKAGEPLADIAEPLSLMQLGRQAAAQLTPLAARERMRVVPGKGDAWVSADPSAVLRIWQNLVSNAVKYASSGKAVYLDAGQDGGRGWLSVSDEGGGLPEGALGRAATPFKREANARGLEGTGLGLASVQALAAAMGGHLVLSNRTNGGLEARVYLPLAEDAGAA